MSSVHCGDRMEKTKSRRFIKSRKLRYVLFFLASVFILTFIIIEGLIIYHASRTSEEKADVVIILGARLYGRTPSPSLQYRLDEGYAYLREHPDTIAVVSGGMGRGEEITEASAMRDYLLDKGIAPQRILTEERSYNTYENIDLSIRVLQENLDGVDLQALKFGIISNDYHIFRGTLIAKEKGLDAFGIPSRTPPTTLVKGYLREYLSVLKYLIVDRNR